MHVPFISHSASPYVLWVQHRLMYNCVFFFLSLSLSRFLFVWVYVCVCVCVAVADSEPSLRLSSELVASVQSFAAFLQQQVEASSSISSSIPPKSLDMETAHTRTPALSKVPTGHMSLSQVRGHTNAVYTLIDSNSDTMPPLLHFLIPLKKFFFSVCVLYVCVFEWKIVI